MMLPRARSRFITACARHAPFISQCSVLDGLLTTYLLALLATAVQSTGPHRNQCIAALVVICSVYLTALSWVRHPAAVTSPAAALIYRLVTYGSFQATYFVLRPLLPMANPGSLDEGLYRLDLRLFGVEPTVWMDRFVSPATTEWFSFFYFAYFPLLAVFLFPIVFFDRRAVIGGDFALGIFMLYCLGHFVYFLVPGIGPYRHLAGLFEHPLPAGRWYRLVLDTVSNGGAQKDIFPSMHTAAPTFLALFSFRHRGERPFRRVWPVVTFFAMNIIGATLFLRWHYLVDIFAGLSLALFCDSATAAIGRRERAYRRRIGIAPSWPELRAPRRDAEAVGEGAR